MNGYLVQRMLHVLDGWSQGVLEGATLGSTKTGERLARVLIVADVLSVLIPLVRPELKSTGPGAPPEPPDVVLSRILGVLEWWALGVLALAGEAHKKTKPERMVAVADVILVLVRLMRPEVGASASGHEL
ncbi:hypothetical protein [Polyangium sp. y55x31]|uniref:hypothetical protein n=1 Tax=Polyangium sp. y55x31 TaxID=3042688 RepID=UPI0024831F0D|nr:hypothetical protein [Polyangium sp. y55x31]MDI1476444.1 hypothetical protein [Polyangium sp. y55x31]